MLRIVRFGFQTQSHCQVEEVGNNCEIATDYGIEESQVLWWQKNENKIFCSQEVKDKDLETEFETDTVAIQKTSKSITLGKTSADKTVLFRATK